MMHILLLNLEDNGFSEYIHMKHFLSAITWTNLRIIIVFLDTLKLFLKGKPDYVTQLLRKAKIIGRHFGIEDKVKEIRIL